MSSTALADAHSELRERCRLADAVDDWRERTLLAPLVDVADYVKRIGDHPDSAHYRAEKAGGLLEAAIRLQCQALMAYADWPDDGPDDGPTCATIDKAFDVLGNVASAVEAVAWSTARAADDDESTPGPYRSEVAQLQGAAKTVLAWSDALAGSARHDPVPT